MKGIKWFSYKNAIGMTTYINFNYAMHIFRFTWCSFCGENQLSFTQPLQQNTTTKYIQGTRKRSPIQKLFLIYLGNQTKNFSAFILKLEGTRKRHFMYFCTPEQKLLVCSFVQHQDVFRPASIIYFKHKLFLFYWAKYFETEQEWSLGSRLLRLYKIHAKVGLPWNWLQGLELRYFGL